MLDLFEMEMPELSKKRMIRVYLPSDYEKELTKHYPVLYMNDAQNLFDKKTSAYGHIWKADQVVESLIKKKISDGIIIVGIDHGPGLERLDEYSPWVSEKMNELNDIDREVGGQGDAYGHFLVKTLKPYIDRHYRTKPGREFTGIGGSSMGAFISLYLGVTHPNVFSKILAMSTAGWFASTSLSLSLKSFDCRYSSKWYLDVGTKETENDFFNSLYIQGTEAAVSDLKEAGVLDNQIQLVIDEGAVHNETAWEKRLPNALSWLFYE